MSTALHLALVPRDGLFCKDSRGWHTSASGRGHALEWPWPSTVLGAIRTAWGRAEEGRTGQRFDPAAWLERTKDIALGRTLALRRPPAAAWATSHRIWPAPSDALRLEGQGDLCRLAPAPPLLPTLGRDDDEAREALWVPILDEVAKPIPAPRWWTDTRFTAWLAGTELPAVDDDNAFDLVRRNQAHVGIRPDVLTADEGVLFSHDVVETIEAQAEWAVGLEAILPSGDVPSTATLGSDGRIARVEPLLGQVFEPPPVLMDAFRNGSPGLRLVVVNPVCFAAGWLPDGFERQATEFRGRLSTIDGELILRAAIVPRSVHVSGWDMAANGGKGAPKPTSRMVPPGAVYFLERTRGRPFDADDARALWLAALGTRTDEGFGRVVPGVWRPARISP